MQFSQHCASVFNEELSITNHCKSHRCRHYGFLITRILCIRPDFLIVNGTDIPPKQSKIRFSATQLHLGCRCIYIHCSNVSQDDVTTIILHYNKRTKEMIYIERFVKYIRTIFFFFHNEII